MNKDETIKVLEELIKSLREEKEPIKKWEPKQGDFIQVNHGRFGWLTAPKVFERMTEYGTYVTTSLDEYTEVRRFLCPIQWIERKLGDPTRPKWTKGVLFIGKTGPGISPHACENLNWHNISKWRPITDDMAELRRVFEEEGQA